MGCLLKKAHPKLGVYNMAANEIDGKLNWSVWCKAKVRLTIMNRLVFFIEYVKTAYIIFYYYQ